jgi:hypothetical protein
MDDFENLTRRILNLRNYLTRDEIHDRLVNSTNFDGKVSEDTFFLAWTASNMMGAE